MRKLLLFLGVIISFPCLAVAPSAEVGRYQVVPLHKNVAILVDTITGTTYRSIPCNGYDLATEEQMLDSKSVEFIYYDNPHVCWLLMKKITQNKS